MEENYAYEELTDEEKKSVKDNIFRHIQVDPYGFRRFSRHWTKSWKLSGIAAMIVIAISFALYLLIDSSNDSEIILLAAKTGPLEKKEITMSDSTVIILNAGSSLSYNSQYKNGQREVFLEGNAFFKVKKTALRQPFVVHANSMEVTVLGTQFNVNARSKETEVVLTSGKVQVSVEGEKKMQQDMLPGEKLTIDTLAQLLVKSPIDTQLYSAWTKGEWNFHHTSLEQAAGLIKEYYGVGAIFKNGAHKRLAMTAVIPVTTLENLVPIIAKTLQINMNLVNNQLIIQ